MAELGPLTCAGCGILCDDVIVERSHDAARLQPPCRLGAEWFSARMGRPTRPPATIRGQAVDVEVALSRAAELLRGARRPLLHGFEGATVEDARAAVALADRLGALIATEALGEPWAGGAAVALRGASTATLGEIRDRSRLVVIWREDPESSHPRLLERLGLGAGGSSRPGAARTVVVVDDRDTATTERADLRLRWPRERDLEALIALHAMQRQLTLPPSELEVQLRELLERVTAVGHAAVVYGSALCGGGGGQRRALALHELVRGLSGGRHVVTLALSRAAGITGAQDALVWQTGYAGNVDLAPGHPEPVSGTRPLETDMGVDVSVRIEGVPAPLPAAVAEIALGSMPAGWGGAEPEVVIRTAAPGVEADGTAHRLDGVPLRLQAPLPADAPTAATLLRRLLAEVEP